MLLQVREKEADIDALITPIEEMYSLLLRYEVRPSTYWFQATTCDISRIMCLPACTAVTFIAGSWCDVPTGCTLTIESPFPLCVGPRAQGGNWHGLRSAIWLEEAAQAGHRSQRQPRALAGASWCAVMGFDILQPASKPNGLQACRGTGCPCILFLASVCL